MTRAAGQVVDMMVSGVPFAQVQDAIDVTPVRREEEATLWLLAWSLRPWALAGATNPAHDSIDRFKLRDGREIRIRPVPCQEKRTARVHGKPGRPIASIAVWFGVRATCA